jgi:2-polyprenyl-3-methyl-5-hydroxy-6-metoxy-1,4-benzoquinol methylase
VTDPGAHQYDYEERLEVLPSIPAAAQTIADVGCSRGGFGVALRRSRGNVELWGIDADSAIAAEAAPHYDRFLNGFFPEVLAEEDVRFDCIVFNDVLEHMADPWAALRAAHSWLAPGGTVVGSIPNVRYFPVVARLLVLGDFSYTRNGVLDRTHLRFFTKRTVRDLFECSGFEVQNVRGIAPWRGRRRLAQVAPPGVDDALYRQFVVTGRSPSSRA